MQVQSATIIVTSAQLVEGKVSLAKKCLDFQLVCQSRAFLWFSLLVINKVKKKIKQYLIHTIKTEVCHIVLKQMRVCVNSVNYFDSLDTFKRVINIFHLKCSCLQHERGYAFCHHLNLR